jgi:hypothetical protein
MSTAQEFDSRQDYGDQAGKIAKFVAQTDSGTFRCNAEPDGIRASTLRIFDTVTFPGGGAGDVTYGLPARIMDRTGKPSRRQGIQVQGHGCKIVLIKPSVIKRVQRSVPFTTPSSGGRHHARDSVRTSAAYCAGVRAAKRRKNDNKLTKRKNHQRPGSARKCNRRRLRRSPERDQYRDDHVDTDRDVDADRDPDGVGHPDGD